MSSAPDGLRPPIKVVLVVRGDLAVPHAVNAAAVLGASAGAALNLPVGSIGTDGSGTRYAGIVTTPVPVLVADAAAITALFHDTSAKHDLSVVVLTDIARRARTYSDYLAELARTEDADDAISAMLIVGPRGQVTKLTKRLPLLAEPA